MTTKEDRKRFVNDIKLKLELCNYGFQVDENKYSFSGYSFSEVRDMKAIKELTIRLNIWEATGKEDKGTIEYLEARRVIDYKLDGKNIGRCRVDLLKN